MNPGKVVSPYRLDENLRLGSEFNHPEPKTHFAYPDDRASFSFAMMRCVGVGECRKEHHGTMCPSYMVTREEEHSTRGRARLLYEMLERNPLTGGWRDEHVREALDLCLACKACKSECPVNVDMATYKAEFLSHYYDGRLRPMAAYTMGWIHWWARLAGHVPRVANFFAQTRPFSQIIKTAAGIAPQRVLPQFALRPFTASFRQPNTAGPTLLLWPDTFNNYFHPETCRDALEVLQRAGFDVKLPGKSLCCGRPLYDFGFLKTAKRLLRQILDVLREDVRAGITVVVLEPSCAAVFRDEMVNLFPHDADAQRLSRQTFLLSEFLEKKAPEAALPRLAGKAVIHGHCHHKAIMKMDDEEKVLSKLGLQFEVLDSGCCGMAGAFGFERDHYHVSVKAAERVLLPRVRECSEDTLIIANGFSCREQIRQLAGRRAFHLAEVINSGFRKELL
jgi:Fe-S oxidoreductase